MTFFFILAERLLLLNMAKESVKLKVVPPKADLGEDGKSNCG